MKSLSLRRCGVASLLLLSVLIGFSQAACTSGGITNEPAQIVCQSPIVVNADPNQCSATVNILPMNFIQYPGVSTARTALNVAVARTTPVDPLEWDITYQGVSCSGAANPSEFVNDKHSAWNSILGSGYIGITGDPFNNVCQGQYTVTQTMNVANFDGSANGRIDVGYIVDNRALTIACGSAAAVTVPDSIHTGSGQTLTYNSANCNDLTKTGLTTIPFAVQFQNDGTSPNPMGISITMDTQGFLLNSVGYTDNCHSLPTLTSTLAVPVGSQKLSVGTYSNKWTATEPSGEGGRASFCTHSIQVIDNQPPVITCPSVPSTPNDSGFCSAKVTYTAPVGTDNCAATTAQTGGLSSGSAFPVGTTTNKFTVTDSAGASNFCSFVVTVTDSENPIISCPSSINANNDPGTCSRVVSYAVPTGSDNCPLPTIALASGLNSGSSFPVGSTTNTWKITDTSNNVAQCSFDVNISDNESPVITCPLDMSQNADPGLCTAAVTYTAPVGTDNCPGATTSQTTGLASGAGFPVGQTTNTFKVTAGGLSSTCSWKVTVTDAQTPTITCSGPVSANTAAGRCDAVVAYSTPVGTDNCASTTTQTAGLASGSTFTLGTTSNIFKVTDSSGNSAQCTVSVNVVDAQAPTITCTGPVTANTAAGRCDAVVSYTTPVGTDNCASTTAQTAGLASGATFSLGLTSNTYKVTDSSGNSAQCTIPVTVVDAQAPTITCPSSIVANTDANKCTAAVNYAAPIPADNCPGSTSSQTQGLASGSNFPVGSTTNTFQATDAAGTVSTPCSFSVQVNDAQNPVITTCPSTITQANDPGVCSAVVTYSTPGTSDNCPGSSAQITTGSSTLSGSTFSVGTTAVSWQAKDAAGNTGSAPCAFNVVVQDTENPTLSVAATLSYNTDPSRCYATVNSVAYTASDNCILHTESFNPPLGGQFNVGSTSMTITSTDQYGNFVNRGTTIQVTDNELPFISCPGVVYAAPDTTIFYRVGEVATDNCGVPSVAQISGPAVGDEISTPGSYPTVWSATDVNGNTYTCNFNVVVDQAYQIIDVFLYMYLGVRVTIPAAVVAELQGENLQFELLDIGSGATVYTSEMVRLSGPQLTFGGVHGVLPAVYDFVLRTSVIDFRVSNMNLCSSPFVNSPPGCYDTSLW